MVHVDKGNAPHLWGINFAFLWVIVSIMRETLPVLLSFPVFSAVGA